MTLFKPNSPALALSLVLSLAAMQAGAGSTDLASSPLTVKGTNSIQPNVLYVLDDSGSMDWDWMPDYINSYKSDSVNSCRSTGATSSSSGSFGNACCTESGSAGNACWRNQPPFSNAAHPPFLASTFNGMAYNPAVRYRPPLDAAGNSYPSQTDATSVRNDYYQVQNKYTINLLTQFPDLAWCTSDDHTDCLRNGNYVLPGTVNGKDYTTQWVTVASGTGSVASGNPAAPTVTANVSFGPHYYTITPGEYCTTSALRNCQTSQTVAYNVPAYVRWCNSTANASAASPATGVCQASRNSTYKYPRYPTRFFTAGTAAVAAQAAVPASLDIKVEMKSCSKSKTAAVNTLTVNGVDLFGGNATTATKDASTLASSIATQINAKTISTGYSASSSGSTVKIKAPLSAGNLTAKATLTATSGSTCTFSPTTSNAFSGYQAEVLAQPAQDAGFPGGFTRVDIVSGKTYTKSGARDDCAGSSCTYTEELTNFANWWAYYHTRMQATKSAILSAFASVGKKWRVGYMSIDNNGGSQFLNLYTFLDDPSDTISPTQKTDWYNKIYKAKPDNGTPLRTSLANAGRLYGGKLSKVNDVTVKDPVQYACQKNFTILSTDGFWNDSSTPKQLNGSSDIGDQDSGLDRPQYDGTSTSDTLADVASYYYRTDLRTGTTGAAACTSGSSGSDVCGNGETYAKQNMVTFTLGLGVSGYMRFDPDYLKQTSGDYFSVKNGSTADPASDVCSWQTSGACNWPTPQSDKLTAVDDLWHAAINGGGKYFSAGDPTTLAKGLASALSSIDKDNGAGAAAATSNPNITPGDNAIYLTSFNSGVWSGEVRAGAINSDGSLSNTVTWSAANQLDTRSDPRVIYMFSPGDSNKLKAFDWDAMSTTEKGYFAKSYIAAGANALSQFCNAGVYCLSAADQTAAADKTLVDFLRGDRSNEGEVPDPKKFYRVREHVLGDPVNARSLFVGNSSSNNYKDAGYSTFKSSSTVTGRKRMLYVAANDGMLHAFDADDASKTGAKPGSELWAYVPTAVLPNLFQLADKEYAGKHRYYVDSTPVVQDIKIGSNWRTILVGGLGGGGRAYYALDITDPENPQALWEYAYDATACANSDPGRCNLGYTYGTPEIGKLADGTWAVFFGSGYNNVSSGDGKGYLYVLDAATGTLIRTIDTGAGSSASPAGLAQVRAWINSPNTDNTVQRVYAGDNLGNVWRFDVNNAVGATGYDAQLLATLRTTASPGSVAQPVTTRPVLNRIKGTAVIYVGTGRYLGTSDYTNTDTQSVYAIKDDLSDTANHGNPRDVAAKFVQQTLTDGVCPDNNEFCNPGTPTRTNDNPAAMDWTTKGGWYVDLPASAERVNTDPQIVQNTLVVTSNVITTGNSCRVGGYSFVNYFDATTGGPVANANGLVSVFLGDALSAGSTIYATELGTFDGELLTNNQFVPKKIPLAGDIQPTRRLSWRDLNQD